MPAAAFRRAIGLLRLLVHDLEMTVYGELAQGELENARRSLWNVEAENARLLKELRHHLPEISSPRPRPSASSHEQQIVGEMIDFVRRNYRRPIHLGTVACALKMNAAYLSSLFSHTAGMTFHQYLDELRLAKAKELLRNPLNRVCEVADAVGYASPDHFGHAFKAHTGLPPSRWRQGC